MTKYRPDYRIILLTALVTRLISSPAWAIEGSLDGWGSNNYGETDVPAGNDYVAIAGGLLHSLALKSDGSLAGWGDNSGGQTTVPAGNDFVAIAAGSYHSLALKSDGSLAGWGYNGNGQADVPAGSDFVAIAGGNSHSLALKADGSLIGWGDNFYGQTTVPAGNDFLAIAAGGFHSLALKSDGSLAGWGSNLFGETNVPAGNQFVAVAAGFNHNLALKSDGSLAGWGLNGDGQTTAPTGNDFVAIAAGAGHSLALKSDGSLAGWGSNLFGATDVPAGIDFLAIAAGGYHGLAIQEVPEPASLALVVFCAAALVVRRSRRITNLLCLCCALSVTAAAQAAIEYTVTDLGIRGDPFLNSVGTGINASGQVSGSSYTTGYTEFQAFLWTPTTPNGASGTMIDLGTLGGSASTGFGINSSCQVAGLSFTTDDAADRAFLWKPTMPGGASGTMHDLGTLGGNWSNGFGINDSGQVTGYSGTTEDSVAHAFMWKPTTPNGVSGAMYDLGTLGGTYSEGHDINASGQVAGYSFVTEDAAHAFMWKPTTPGGTSGTIHDLGTLGGTYSGGAGINAGGQVAGFSTLTGDTADHAILWTPTTPGGTTGTMLDLETLGGTYSAGEGINDSGQVVGGSYTTDDAAYHAFLYTSGSGMVDLNTLIDPLSGWELSGATDINDAGQITGQGFIDDEYHAFLLTPVLVGDYNGDGKVSAADFTVWRDNLGTATILNRDPANTGPVGIDDFNSWKTNYGTGFGSGTGVGFGVTGSANIPIPEPATGSLATGMMMLIVCRATMCKSPPRAGAIFRIV